MTSASHAAWTTIRAAALDEIEAAHRSVGCRGPGRRCATRQVNHAYAVLLSAQFQAFCRDLYEECVVAFVKAVAAPGAKDVLLEEYALHVRLDRGNPNPGNIGADFNRLGIPFWDAVVAADV